MTKSLSLVGYASGIGGADPNSGKGAEVLQKSDYFSLLSKQGVDLHWEAIVSAAQTGDTAKMPQIAKQCDQLGKIIARLVNEQRFFTLFGGDHSCAVGTWSGVSFAKKSAGAIGLIWIDAHMDSHTPQTSLSGNIHGMPVAALLGHGDPSLTNLLHKGAKLQPEHICIIGVRSYEQAEIDFLKQLNVRVFFMEEVKQRGIAAVFADAVKIVTKGTVGYGISLDLDGIDPLDAPGTGTAVPDGIRADELCRTLATVGNDPHLLGIEIVEFDPMRDKNRQTEQLIIKILAALCGVPVDFVLC